MLDQLLALVKVFLVFLELLGTLTIADHPTGEHLSDLGILYVLLQDAHAEVFLEIFLGALGQPDCDLFECVRVEELGHVEG